MFKISEEMKKYFQNLVNGYKPVPEGAMQGRVLLSCGACTGRCGNNCIGSCAGSCRGNCSGSCQRYQR